MNILSTHNLTKTYGTGDNVVHALTDVSLDIEEGKFVSIIGSSGSGKSTLLKSLRRSRQANIRRCYTGRQSYF